MVRTVERLTISSLVAFLVGAGISACNPQGTKPTIEPGTVFQQVSQGSNVYREVPKDRPVITDYKRGER
jgi:hypothetical protein